jgi:DNA polymerase-3 subunit alpha
MLEGAMEPKAIAEHAAKLGFPAVALTDRNGLYAAMAFTEACSAKGIQPIVGAMLAVARPAEMGSTGVDWLVLLAKDEQGYSNLCHLVSAAHLDRPVELDPHVAFAALEKSSEGLIALTAGSEGALARLLADGQKDTAKIYLDRLQALFPDRLYIEIIRRNDPVEAASEDSLIDLAFERDLPLVATNPAAYSDPSFHAAHDAMLCIAQSAYIESNDRKTSSSEAWLKDSPSMGELFIDLPEAIANTVVIAQRCAVGAPKRKPILPRLSDHEDEQLRADAHAGLNARLAGRSEEEMARYRERLDFEIDVITRMGFAGYFLIVADFIKWAKAHDIPVGPGRGSGAGSVVAWALTITVLDPLALNLLFEKRGATRSSPTSSRNTAATGWRRSSPSGASRRAPCSRTRGACCR